MTIDHVGKSITKLGLAESGENFFNSFIVERPLETASFKDIRRQSNSLFIIRTNKIEGFKFRGQMYFDESNERLYFLGSPLIKSFDDLKEVDLTLNDFALHDNINQFLFTTQMLISSLKDSKNIAERLEKSNQDLKQKNSELQDFAYVLSHDLKSPIRGILSLAEFMQDDIENNNMKEVPFYLKTMKERVIRMNNLIEGILDFSKIGIEKATKEEIDLNVLVDNIFTDTVNNENIVYTIKNKLPTIYNIRVLFVQLFSNLISNAIKYNDKEQGQITIEYKELKGFHEFSIADNGPGISENYHEKIFQLFQTLNPGENIQNTGVGLSIVKKIITLLNGNIRVESKINEGTIFFVQIPLN